MAERAPDDDSGLHDDVESGVESFVFADDGRIPNSRLPLVVIRAAVALDGDDPARAFERTFAGNGWTGAWRDGIYGYHHYHSTAHEVLGIAEGSARVRFGGDRGKTLTLDPGDVVVIPAGTGHRLVEGARTLVVVGAYAGGRDWDVIRDDPDEIGTARLRIAAVPLPDKDPVDGASGPLLRLWRP
jgi:uncharacterized protein YjlB